MKRILAHIILSPIYLMMLLGKIGTKPIAWAEAELKGQRPKE